jgi:hypothetical protein
VQGVRFPRNGRVPAMLLDGRRVCTGSQGFLKGRGGLRQRFLTDGKLRS